MVLFLMVLVGVEMLVTALLFSSVAGQQDKLNAESLGRRDQNCIVFERIHQVDVIQVRSTYAYLANLSAQQLTEPINRAILAQLPTTEKRMRKSRAPAYCANPGVGLDDRKLEPEPKRPPEVDRLLR
jgi:hypothetical protein